MRESLFRLLLASASAERGGSNFARAHAHGLGELKDLEGEDAREQECVIGYRKLRT